MEVAARLTHLDVLDARQEAIQAWYVSLADQEDVLCSCRLNVPESYQFLILRYKKQCTDFYVIDHQVLASVE